MVNFNIIKKIEELSLIPTKHGINLIIATTMILDRLRPPLAFVKN